MITIEDTIVVIYTTMLFLLCHYKYSYGLVKVRDDITMMSSGSLGTCYFCSGELRPILCHTQEKLPSKMGRTGLPSERTNGDNDGLSRPRT